MDGPGLCTWKYQLCPWDPDPYRGVSLASWFYFSVDTTLVVLTLP